jgi:hypothetical protein
MNRDTATAPVKFNNTDDEGDEYAPEWYPYEGGRTLGRTGPEEGIVLRDEELGDPDDEEEADARLTLERGRSGEGGFTLVATLYGWLYHAHRVEAEEKANSFYEQMRGELENLTELLPYEEDGERVIAEKAARLEAETEAFAVRYPNGV